MILNETLSETGSLRLRLVVALTGLSNVQAIERGLELLEKSLSMADSAELNTELGKVSEKYKPLSTYLLKTSEDELVVSFGKLESILGFKLPQAARGHRAWWANTLTHSQATSWMRVGWKMVSVNLDTETAKFKRSLTTQ